LQIENSASRNGSAAKQIKPAFDSAGRNWQDLKKRQQADDGDYAIA